jgi:radical SAM superfamily enzyme YgiQ (UPF0313 family)
MSRVLVFTFDLLRRGAPKKGYSIASIAAFVKHHMPGTTFDYFSLNLLRPWLPYRMRNVVEVLNLLRIRRYDAILVPDYVWSGDDCKCLTAAIRRLRPFGKIVVGGYQVTATPDHLLDEYYPDADYCIKGYAEEAVVQILQGRQRAKAAVVAVDVAHLVSPYLSGEIQLGSHVRSARWETKRGCPYSCGFCEWSALPDRKMYNISRDRLRDELAVLSRSSVTKVDVLDGTFNAGDTYLELVDAIGQIRNIQFHLQTRPEPLTTPKGEEFLRKCAEYRNVYLELGIQTIVADEMRVIGRDNDVERVGTSLRRLTELGIPYETNLIYGIPGQTLPSFHKSIDFLVGHGCPVNRIKAYALRIPRTSRIELASA